MCKIKSSFVSASRGWELMSFCVTTFPPGKDFLKYLAAFIMSAPKEHQGIAAYCLRALKRTLQTGSRKLVHSNEEFEAISVF